jgi:hypothetical protein
MGAVMLNTDERVHRGRRHTRLLGSTMMAALLISGWGVAQAQNQPIPSQPAPAEPLPNPPPAAQPSLCRAAIRAVVASSLRQVSFELPRCFAV